MQCLTFEPRCQSCPCSTTQWQSCSPSPPHQLLDPWGHAHPSTVPDTLMTNECPTDHQCKHHRKSCIHTRKIITVSLRPHLVFAFPNGKPRRVAVDHKTCDALVPSGWVGVGHHKEHASFSTVRNPQLFAVQLHAPRNTQAQQHILRMHTQHIVIERAGGRTI